MRVFEKMCILDLLRAPCVEMDNWSLVGAADGSILPTPRHGHVFESVSFKDAGGVWKEELYLFWGGNYGLAGSSDAYCLDPRDPTKWEKFELDTKDKSFDTRPRASVASASCGSEIYVFGGVFEGEQGDEISNSVFRFLNSLSYSMPRRGHLAVQRSPQTRIFPVHEWAQLLSTCLRLEI